MAALDYLAISDAIGAALAAHASLSDALVIVEEDFFYGITDAAKAVGVYCNGRVPTSEQPLAAGTRTRLHVSFEILCAGLSMESIRTAIAIRDDLIGPVELVLMGNRTFGRSDIASSWLNGGDLFSAKNPNNGQFMAVGQVLLTIEATAINA